MEILSLKSFVYRQPFLEKMHNWLEQNINMKGNLWIWFGVAWINYSIISSVIPYLSHQHRCNTPFILKVRQKIGFSCILKTLKQVCHLHINCLRWTKLWTFLGFFCSRVIYNLEGLANTYFQTLPDSQNTAEIHF